VGAGGRGRVRVRNIRDIRRIRRIRGGGRLGVLGHRGDFRGGIGRRPGGVVRLVRQEGLDGSLVVTGGIRGVDWWDFALGDSAVVRLRRVLVFRLHGGGLFRDVTPKSG
jgi:hypothetical protein